MKKIFLILSISFSLVLVNIFLAPAVMAEKKIHITADKLKINSSGKEAEFSGKVKALFDDTIITAEKMKIFFKEKKASKEKIKKGDKKESEEIEKIIASKNVKIKNKDVSAECEKAIYFEESQILELTGKNTKAVKGKNTIAGDKIIIEMKTNNILIEKGPEKRVEAFFYSEEEN